MAAHPPAQPLRFGVLGAARIAPKALVRPVHKIGSAVISRIAARDTSRAEAFAAEHGVEGVCDSYEALIEADDVDVVYNPLPINLHHEWTIKALRAGKHVLCEKPFASNAEQAAEMVEVADDEGRVLGEAFHHRHHPMFQRIVDVIASGVIGEVTRSESYFNIAIPRPDIRWDYATSGGSLMDLGCYATIWTRHTVGEEPTIAEAEATVGPENIDGAIWAEMAFPGGATGRIESSMINEGEPDIRLEVTGTLGSITAINPLSPQSGNSLTIRTSAGETSGEIVAGDSYEHMVRTFCDHVIHGTPYLTQGEDSIQNMAAIDSVYLAAGLPVRGASS